MIVLASAFLGNLGFTDLAGQMIELSPIVWFFYLMGSILGGGVDY